MWTSHVSSRNCLLSLVLFGAFVVQSAYSSTMTAPDVKWARGYGFGSTESHPHAGVETIDGGFVLVGDGQDYSGESPFKREIDVLKTDSTGNVQWRTSVGEIGFNYGKFAIQLRDGRIALAGAMSQTDSSLGYPVLKRAIVVLNETSGEEMFRHPLPNEGAETQLRDGFMSVVESPVDGRLFAVGFVGGENATTGYDDEPMFLIQGGKAGITVIDVGREGANVVLDTVIDDTDVDFFAMQAMRVEYDETRDAYAVSYTTVSKSDDGANIQFGMSSVKVRSDWSSFEVQWTRQFLASPGTDDELGGHASHPYALTLGTNASSYVMGGLAVIIDENGIEQCQGRLLSADPDSGNVRWDRRFTSTEKDTNIECYGIRTCQDGGYILTCGTGVEPELHPNDSAKSKTWRVLVHRTDATGVLEWEKQYTSNVKLQNNAGEYIIATRDGGYAIYVDSQTYGPDDTGGNFAIMRLKSDVA